MRYIILRNDGRSLEFKPLSFIDYNNKRETKIFESLKDCANYLYSRCNVPASEVSLNLEYAANYPKNTTYKVVINVWTAKHNYSIYIYSN